MAKRIKVGITSLVLILMMLISMIPLSVMAAEAEDSATVSLPYQSADGLYTQPSITECADECVMDINEEETSVDEYTSNVKEDTAAVAQYSKMTVAPAKGKLTVNVMGGTGFRISIDGGALRPQGTSYVNTKMPIGASVTVVAFPVEGATFIGWMNETGAIVSLTDTFTFGTTGNDCYRAVYQTVVEGVNSVTFKNAKASGGNGQILDMQYYAAGDEIIFPDAPSQAGYAFTGWSMTAEQIQAKLSAGEDVTVVANWEIAKVYIDVVVNGGKVTTTAQSNGKYIAYAALTVVADTAPEGQKFAYWTDANGKIMSYDTQYKSFPAENIELTAVYVAQNEVIERQPLVFMAADPTTSGEKITYTISWDVAASVGTIKNYGLMIVDADDYNKDTFYHGSGDSKIFDRAVSTSKVSNTTSIGKSESLYDHTYYAVAFVIYTNSAGESVTMYSDMVEVYKQAP